MSLNADSFSIASLSSSELSNDDDEANTNANTNATNANTNDTTSATASFYSVYSNDSSSSSSGVHTPTNHPASTNTSTNTINATNNISNSSDVATTTGAVPTPPWYRGAPADDVDGNEDVHALPLDAVSRPSHVPSPTREEVDRTLRRNHERYTTSEQQQHPTPPTGSSTSATRGSHDPTLSTDGKVKGVPFVVRDVGYMPETPIQYLPVDAVSRRGTFASTSPATSSTTSAPTTNNTTSKNGTDTSSNSNNRGRGGGRASRGSGARGRGRRADASNTSNTRNTRNARNSDNAGGSTQELADEYARSRPLRNIVISGDGSLHSVSYTYGSRNGTYTVRSYPRRAQEAAKANGGEVRSPPWAYETRRMMRPALTPDQEQQQQQQQEQEQHEEQQRHEDEQRASNRTPSPSPSPPQSQSPSPSPSAPPVAPPSAPPPPSPATTTPPPYTEAVDDSGSDHHHFPAAAQPAQLPLQQQQQDRPRPPRTSATTPTPPPYSPAAVDDRTADALGLPTYSESVAQRLPASGASVPGATRPTISGSGGDRGAARHQRDLEWRGAEPVLNAPEPVHCGCVRESQCVYVAVLVAVLLLFMIVGAFLGDVL